MNQMRIVLAAIVLVLAISVINGCSRMTEQHTAEEGEESGTELALNETYDKVRNGARLILAYNAQSNSFEGTVENTTAETLKRVRVEVHLSNGKELGPTPSADLAPGEKRDVQLIATSTDFDGWTAHPEVGEGEHSSGGGGGEHDAEGDSEHDGEEGEHN
jgi:hypothetical protein